MAKAGVHLVVERHLPKTRVDGTALLLPHGTPVVALSLRHDRLDHFWFCLLHEVAHIKLHLKLGDEANQEWFVDDFDVSATEEVEEEADQWALDRLVPPEDWKRRHQVLRETPATSSRRRSGSGLAQPSSLAGCGGRRGNTAG